MTREEKRVELKGKIEAARERFRDHPPEDIAVEAASAAFTYAKQNPWVFVGGGAIIGLTLGILSRRSQKTKKTSSVLGRIATDVAIGFALAMYEKASQRAELRTAKSQELIEQQTD